MVQVALNDVSVEGTGSVAVHNTDDQTLEGYYYESVVVDEGTKEIVFHDYPIRGLRNFDLYISLENAPLSFGNIEIRLFGNTVDTVSKEEVKDKCINKDLAGISIVSNSVVINTEPEQPVIIDIGTMLSVKLFAFYFVLLVFLSILIFIIIRFALTKVNAQKLIESHGRFLVFLMDILAVVVIGEVLLKGWGYLGFAYFLLNILIVGSFSMIIISFLGWQIGRTISLLAFAIFYLADYYVISFKGTPLLPWDIKAVRTAMAVSGKYSFSPDVDVMLFLIAILLLVIISGLLIRGQDSLDFSIKKRVAVGLCSFAIGLMVVCGPLLNSMPTNAWGKDITYCYKEYGTISSFVNYYKQNRVQKPKGYSNRYVNELIEKYSNNELSQSEQDCVQPDQIIVIMNESFADLDKYSKTININEMPFFEELSEEAVTGDLCVSVRGGGTCNTEFEVLTGFSMAFLPGASYPFISYLGHKEIFSLARYFRNEGYDIAGLHLEKGSNWSRDVAYHSMGVEPFYTIDDCNQASNLRGFATDASNYHQLIAIDNKMGQQKKFIFNVTIQNHGGYDNPDGLNETVDLSGLESYLSAKTYFNLMKISDDALRDLINHYREESKNTMIVFFGDHQPRLESEVDEKLFNESKSRLDEYTTPVLIWKNYDNRKKELGKISANYLPLVIIKEAGYPLTPFFRIVSEAYESFPVLTTQGIIDSEGNYYKDLSKITQSKDILDDYQIAQYEELFGDGSFGKARY